MKASDLFVEALEAEGVELPEDIAAEETDEPLIPASMVRRPVAEEKSIAAAIELIQEAKHPILVVGAGANRKTTCNVRCALSWTNLAFRLSARKWAKESSTKTALCFWEMLRSRRVTLFIVRSKRRT